MDKAEVVAALCPGCGKPATTVPLAWESSWRFRCGPCNWSWGHPQSMTYVQAVNMLSDAKSIDWSPVGEKP